MVIVKPSSKRLAITASPLAKTTVIKHVETLVVNQDVVTLIVPRFSAHAPTGKQIDIGAASFSMAVEDITTAIAGDTEEQYELVIDPVAFSINTLDMDLTVVEAPTQGPVYYADTEAEANTYASTMIPGDTLVINNGNYSNWDIDVSVSGTAGSKITIMAETDKGVTFGGGSGMQFNIIGDHIVLQDFVFDGVTAAPVVNVTGDDNRITDNNFVDSGDATNHSRHVVRLIGDDNRVDNNLFDNPRCKATGTWQDPLRSQWDHNTFQNTERFGQEEVECIQIGQGDNDFAINSASIIEYNTFDNCDGTGEIFSLKNSNCTVRYNTFIDCASQPVFRGGTNNTFDSNVVVNCQNGLVVSSSGHTITNNLIVNSSVQGLLLRSGTTPSRTPADDCLVAYNTIVGSGNAAIEMDTSGEKPTGCEIQNNLFSDGTSECIDCSNPGSQTIDSNLFYNGGGAITGPTGTNAVLDDPELIGTGVNVTISGSSAAIGEAAVLAAVTIDRSGDARDGSTPDIGCDEYQ